MLNARDFLKIALICATSIAISGQTPDAASQSSGKIVEIQDVVKPSSTIALRADRASGFWTSNFSVLDYSHPEKKVQAVNISARLIGEKAEVVVSVFKGKRFGEINEIVAKLSLSEGESVVVDELKKYGYKPITVRMLAVTTSVSNVPLITNPSSSLKVFVSPIVSTVPAFSVKLVNTASKPIGAIAWHTQTNSRMLLSSLAQGSNGAPLIESDSEFALNIKSGVRPDDEYFIFVIDSVIYEDATIEGDRREADTFFAFTTGRKKALAAIIPLLEASNKDNLKLDLDALITQIDSVTDDGPTENGMPASAVGIAFEGVVVELLDQLGHLDRSNLASLRTEISEITRSYKERQKRLSNQNVK